MTACSNPNRGFWLRFFREQSVNIEMWEGWFLYFFIPVVSEIISNGILADLGRQGFDSDGFDSNGFWIL